MENTKTNIVNFQYYGRFMQLEHKLKKHSYLSKGLFPNALDAKIFNIFKDIKKIPDRNNYPYLYHWYVILKQFAPAVLQKWIQNDPDAGKDQPVYISLLDFVQEQRHSHEGSDRSSKQIKDINNIFSPPLKQNQISSKKFVMNIKIKNRKSVLEYIQKIKELGNKQESILSLIILPKGQKTNQLSCQFQTTNQYCEQFKNQISNWEEVESLQIKKLKKRSKQVTY